MLFILTPQHIYDKRCWQINSLTTNTGFMPSACYPLVQNLSLKMRQNLMNLSIFNSNTHNVYIYLIHNYENDRFGEDYRHLIEDIGKANI